MLGGGRIPRDKGVADVFGKLGLGAGMVGGANIRVSDGGAAIVVASGVGIGVGTKGTQSRGVDNSVGSGGGKGTMSGVEV